MGLIELAHFPHFSWRRRWCPARRKRERFRRGHLPESMDALVHHSHLLISSFGFDACFHLILDLATLADSIQRRPALSIGSF